MEPKNGIAVARGWVRGSSGGTNQDIYKVSV